MNERRDYSVLFKEIIGESVSNKLYNEKIKNFYKIGFAVYTVSMLLFVWGLLNKSIILSLIGIVGVITGIMLATRKSREVLMDSEVRSLMIADYILMNTDIEATIVGDDNTFIMRFETKAKDVKLKLDHTDFMDDRGTYLKYETVGGYVTKVRITPTQLEEVSQSLSNITEYTEITVRDGKLRNATHIAIRDLF